MKLRSWPLVAAAVLFAPAGTPQSQKPVVIGESFTIHSAALNEDRAYYIAKPAGYDGGTERYPVLYVLDGESHFKYASAAAELLASADRTPGLIVVGIASGSIQQRTRDLTPPSTDPADQRFAPGNGGASKFLAFLTRELQPLIEKTYRTRPYRLLAGHSYGGLFAAYVLAEKPAAFHAYLAIDPSLGWNRGAVVDQIGQMLSSAKSLRADIFLATAHSSAPKPGDPVRKFAELLAATTTPGLHSAFVAMNDETHMSIPIRGLHQGLDTVFDGWHLTDPLALYDRGGIEAIHRHFREGGERYGYVQTTSPFMVSMIVAELIWSGRLDEAARVLVHDPKTYPPPWNQFDALARAYDARGDREKTIHLSRVARVESQKRVGTYKTPRDRR